jgi:membrane-bound lytic murein transglycosylase D
MRPGSAVLLLPLVLLAAACAQLPAGGMLTRSEAQSLEMPPTTEASPAEDAVPPQPAEAPRPAAPPPLAVQPPPPPPPPADMWQRIRAGFAMRDLANPLVTEWETWYSTRPEYFARMVERSSRVLFHVMEEIERRKMPAELALLPMIESAYNPQAYSRAHASGMWQFIPSTGKIYGLRQDWWYDGRRDIIAATNAALDYLEKLYAMFGNWELALASYNWGEGAVSRAIARNQAKGLPTDYESLAMPAETRNYLPKLQAVKNIVADPARFGMRLAAIPNEPYFATVTANRHIDVELAARLAEISIEEFRFLNPAHNKPVINANAAETIVLPRDKIEVFLRNLENHDRPLVSWQAYKVKPGDRPETIARKHGITVAELHRINGITGRQRIATGQALLVPVKEGAEPNMPDIPAPKLSMSRTAKTRYVPPSRRGPAAKPAVAHCPAAKNNQKPAARPACEPRRVQTSAAGKPKPQPKSKPAPEGAGGQR